MVLLWRQLFPASSLLLSAILKIFIPLCCRPPMINKKTTKTIRTVPIIQRENVQHIYSIRSEKWSHRSRRPCSTVRAFLTVTVVVLPPCVDTARQCPIVCYNTNLHNQLHRAMLLFRYIYCERLKGRPLMCIHTHLGVTKPRKTEIFVFFIVLYKIVYVWLFIN